MSFKHTKKIEKLTEEFERSELGDNQIPISESEIFNEDTLKLIEEAKKKNQNAFQSYWEFDENDINPWTNKQIEDDPAKQFITFAENGDLKEMKSLVEKIDDRNVLKRLLTFKDSDGYSALHRAAYTNNLNIVKFLINLENVVKDFSVNQLEFRTDMGWTPLQSAVYWNNFQTVEYFLKYTNANINSRSKSGQTCLHLAAQQSNIKESLLCLLTNPFIKFSIKNDQNESAIDIAIRSSKYNMLYEITENNLNKL